MLTPDTMVVLLDDAEYATLVRNVETRRSLYEKHWYRPGEYLADRLRKLRQTLWNLA